MEKTLIGKKIKQLRQEKNYTLKQLSGKSGLSTGFLSQLERGRSTIALDSLSRVATALDCNISSFLALGGSQTGSGRAADAQSAVVRSFELEHAQFAPGIVQAILSHDPSGFNFLPRLYQLLPSEEPTRQPLVMYSHQGEEFIYVLEGCLTLRVEDREDVMYPGDSVQVRSSVDHNWINRTSRIVKFLAVNLPNPLHDDNSGH
ncbi:MAG: XRE family transcriptional regulator [Deltaproteobacteria bacterium]|jgi:transcriptional regulator with XRE-family HTH domain|nr:XRE family transcriptional regulator [Deltaproteobacteria bacterium]